MPRGAGASDSARARSLASACARAAQAKLLTVLDVGPFSADCCAYAHWQQAEDALQRSGELTIKTAEGHPRVNPLVRVASQAMDDMRRIGALSSAYRRTRGYG